MSPRVPALVMVMLTTLSCADDLTIRVPPGVTALGDIGIYSICYQSYGEPVTQMPESWMGDFEDKSGIAYQPNDYLLGRSAMLLHSPWRVDPGMVWVDYRLELPKVTPISLDFGIAMRPDVAVPDKSDGVTFSAYLGAEGRARELMRQFHDRGEWRDYHFDLSPWAGQEIVLRFQTEPGPANNPSFDFSYFGAPRITAGSGETAREAVISELTSTRAYRATADVSLAGLSNDPKQGVLPSNLLDCKTKVTQVAGGYEFAYDAADGHLVYRYTPQTGTLDDFTVRFDDGRSFRPATGGAVRFVSTASGKQEIVSARSARLVALDLLPGGLLKAVWEYDLGASKPRLTWLFEIRGKALALQVTCNEPVVSDLSLGNVSGAQMRRALNVPYLPGGPLSYLPADNLFVARYLDWTRSNSSRCPQGRATYDAKTDGTRNRLSERGYIAVSPNINEVLPNSPWTASSYLDLLGPRIMLDIWGHNKGTYQGDAENLRELKDNGVDHVAIINHVWQRYGYDVKLPDHLPANPAYGGDEGMIEFGKAAKECGYVWSLHENYIDLYPDAPSYDPAARVLQADGSPSKAWYNAGTGVQSFGLKCNRALGYAQQNSPEIHRRFATNAAYLDVHTCVPPWHQLDHEAGQPMAAMCRAKVLNDGALFDFMRTTHVGPLFGEGANHFYWAGKCDGVEAQVAGGENHVPFLDFDLLKIHPQMVNHGMGYYERWFERGYGHRFGVDTGTVEQVDKYRAQELAYGHAGFIGSQQINNLQWVAKEHHLMHAVQRLTGTAKPVQISYEVNGTYVSASVALAVEERWRQRIQYDSGLTLWVNWSKEPWTVEGRTLPQWGFLALGPDTEVCMVLQDGKYADYALCPEYLFADARTSFNMPYLRGAVAVEPRLKTFEYLGGDRVRVTYEWLVGQNLDRDYHCFVHFCNSEGPGTEGIVFQQDHATPKPTSEWKAGETITDGPYEVTVPADKFDSYDLLTGLFNGDRLSLKGRDAGGSKVLLARLKLTRKDGVITKIELADEAELTGAEVRRADFTAHLNQPGASVDFGLVATDGSVKVNRGDRSLTVFPYPREKQFNVTLDVAKLSGGAASEAKLQVRALAAGTQANLGTVPFQMTKGRLSFQVGMKGAGRYVVSW